MMKMFSTIQNDVDAMNAIRKAHKCTDVYLGLAIVFLGMVYLMLGYMMGYTSSLAEQEKEDEESK